ncbi:hypothetical protein DPSP01_007279 [Paraphaeosphaeria sporulosa]|uniref:Kelch repeat-containing protein n=1 Tax=Paraphaeosphaeria sporulosa TaxID=1460663 RepID=A0A177C3C4_9PLEO|nr:kelch repeat-containing protein [Paraphaeosphaeria sporulosa]OAG02244.1 kelch repeat-containing protein [Paraphaeosphaeria sporulosa]
MRSLALIFSTFASLVLSETWHRLPDVPISPRQEHATVLLPPGDIVLVGGVTNGTQSTTSLVQSYSITRRKWTSLPPLPVPLNHPNAAVLSGQLYVFGGLAQKNTSWTAIPNSYRYDAKTRSWRRIADVPDGGVGSAAVGVWDGKVILAGGLKEIQLVSPYTQSTISSVYIYDSLTNAYLALPAAAAQLPDTRDHACGAVIEHRFYVLGGRERGQLTGKSSVPVLDLNDLNKGWSVAEGIMPSPRAGLACGIVGKKVYTFGGEGNLKVESGVWNSTEVYDVAQDSWNTLVGMKVPRHGGGAVAFNGKIYVPGGGDVIGISPTSYFDVFVT